MEFPVIPALILTLLFSLCGTSGGGPSPPAAAGGDCGVFAADGQDCFEAAMGSCASAKALLFEGVPPVMAEIQGASVGGPSCSVSLRGIGKSEIGRILFENGGSQSEVDEINARIDSSPGFSGLEGKTATCVVDKLKVRSFAGSYVYVCSGPLIDEINRLDLVKKFSYQ